MSQLISSSDGPVTLAQKPTNLTTSWLLCLPATTNWRSSMRRFESEFGLQPVLVACCFYTYTNGVFPGTELDPMNMGFIGCDLQDLRFARYVSM
jgi:hypothetical protein